MEKEGTFVSSFLDIFNQCLSIARFRVADVEEQRRLPLPFAVLNLHLDCTLRLSMSQKGLEPKRTWNLISL